MPMLNNLINHLGSVIWLTGLSASGKTTLAEGLQRRLNLRGYKSYVLDGDDVRIGLSSDLSFSQKDRKENIRRISEVAKLFADAGLICITASISPYAEDRLKAKKLILDKKIKFYEIYISTPINICESRDPKGLYLSYRRNQIKEFTGIDAPYEASVCSDLVIDTSYNSIEASLDELEDYVLRIFL